jgi:hypothetical protein
MALVAAAPQDGGVEKSMRELAAMSAAQAMTTNKAVVALVGNQHSTAQPVAL